MILEQYNLNELTEERDRIIFGKYNSKAYSNGHGRRKIDGLTVVQFAQLVELGCIDLDKAVYRQPPSKEFFAFMQEFPMYTAAGHAYQGNIRIDRLEKKGRFESDRERALFLKFASLADNYLIKPNHSFIWFD